MMLRGYEIRWETDGTLNWIPVLTILLMWYIYKYLICLLRRGWLGTQEDPFCNILTCFSYYLLKEGRKERKGRNLFLTADFLYSDLLRWNVIGSVCWGTCLPSCSHWLFPSSVKDISISPIIPWNSTQMTRDWFLQLVVFCPGRALYDASLEVSSHCRSILCAYLCSESLALQYSLMAFCLCLSWLLYEAN